MHTTSTSVDRGNRSTSHQVRRERTLDVADLGALPRGRAVVFTSGAPATLVETVPWMKGQHADAVRASIAAHDPASRPAVATAMATLPTPAAAPVLDSPPVDGSQAWLEAAPRKDEL